jgi:hypothetical protein
VSESQARDNGLPAESYTPLADLHPQMASEMLDALRDAGIAAYATPSPTSDDLIDSAEVNWFVDAGVAPDRVFVDAAMKPRAEQILRTRLPRFGDRTADDAPPAALDKDRDADQDVGTGVVERDEDAIWAEIVASFDRDTATEDTETPWPEEENLSRTADQDDEASQDRSGKLPTARVIQPAAEDDEFPDDEDEDEDEDEHFVPPAPPPLPNVDSATKGAWIALFSGPLYLLLAAILGWQVPGWVAFVAVAAFVGGFVYLVLRMGDDPRDPDDGAVV